MKNYIRKLSILDFTNLLFLGMVVLLYIAAFYRTPYRIELLTVYLALTVLIWFSIHLRNRFNHKPWQRITMLVILVLFLLTMFESFFMLIPFFSSARYDALLSGIDYDLFGVHPTVWFERWIHPLLTEVLYVLYAFYFPMPLIVVGWMLKKQKYREVEQAIFVLMLCYYSAYIIYFLVPAQGPRFFMADLQSVPLNGYLLAEPIRNTINFLEPNKLDAFPSLHTAILLLTMLIARKYHRKMYLIFLPIAVGILISLVYLRYHYVIDVLAGALLALLSWIFGNRLYEKYHERFDFHFWTRQA